MSSTNLINEIEKVYIVSDKKNTTLRVLRLIMSGIAFGCCLLGGVIAAGVLFFLLAKYHWDTQMLLVSGILMAIGWCAWVISQSIKLFGNTCFKYGAGNRNDAFIWLGFMGSAILIANFIFFAAQCIIMFG